MRIKKHRTSGDIDGGGELDESNVSGKEGWPPVGVDVFLGGTDLKTLRLGQADVVSAQVDVEVTGTVSIIK